MNEAALILAERARCAALVAGDMDALDAIIADDVIHVHGHGLIDDKQGYLAGVRDKYIFHEVDRGALTIRILGDFAIMVGPLRQTLSRKSDPGKYLIEGVTTQTWTRQGGRWRQASCHNSFLKQIAAE